MSFPVGRIAITAAIITAALLGVAKCAQSRGLLPAARANADSAHVAAQAALASGRATLEAAAEYKAQADSALDSARTEHQRATAADRDASAHLAAYRALRATAPDTCRPIVLAADNMALADSVRGAAQVAEIGDLHKSIISLQNRGDTLSVALPAQMAATGRTDAALTNLSRATKPTLLSRITPHLGVGLALGVDAAGAPHTIIGVTLGWTF